MTPYYSRDGITIFCGDCLEVMPQLSEIDLVITSPPYNLGISTGGGLKGATNSGKWKTAKLANGYDTFSDALSTESYKKWQRKFLELSWKMLSKVGAIFYNHKPRVQAGILQLPLDLNPNLPLRQIIIWKRAGGINFSPSHYLPIHEWIMIFAKPDFRLKNQGASGVGDVWEITQESNNSHPAPFPLELPTMIIETTNAQIICDPFMGSGTTLVAAQNEGRQAIGIEISEDYCKNAVDRLTNTKYISLPNGNGKLKVEQLELIA